LDAKLARIEVFIQYGPGFLNGTASAAADSGQEPNRRNFGQIVSGRGHGPGIEEAGTPIRLYPVPFV
jgi:hypothetical protein